MRHITLKIAGDSKTGLRVRKMDRRVCATIKKAVAGLSRNRRRQLYSKLRKGVPETEHLILQEAIESVESDLSGSWFTRIWKLDSALDTVEARLGFYDKVCGWITVGSLLQIFRWRFDWPAYFGEQLLNTDSWEHFLRDHGAATVLLVVVISSYYLSRKCVKTEMQILSKLFSPSRRPMDWAKVTGNRHIVKMVIVYLAAYSGMSWWTNDIRIVAVGFVIIYVVSYFNQLLTSTNVQKYFSDDRLAPDKDDEHREFILRRRRVVEEYLRHPHLTKEAAVVVGSTLALAIGVIGKMRNSNFLVAEAYIVLILTLIGNEALVASWRVVRRRLIDAIDDDEHVADLQRIRSG